MIPAGPAPTTQTSGTRSSPSRTASPPSISSPPPVRRTTHSERPRSEGKTRIEDIRQETFAVRSRQTFAVTSQDLAYSCCRCRGLTTCTSLPGEGGGWLLSRPMRSRRCATPRRGSPGRTSVPTPDPPLHSSDSTRWSPAARTRMARIRSVPGGDGAHPHPGPGRPGLGPRRSRVRRVRHRPALGHAGARAPGSDRAVAQAIADGVSFSRPTVRELEAAETFVPRSRRGDGRVRQEQFGRHHRCGEAGSCGHRSAPGGDLPHPALLLHRRLVHRVDRDERRHPRGGARLHGWFRLRRPRLAAGSTSSVVPAISPVPS